MLIKNGHDMIFHKDNHVDKLAIVERSKRWVYVDNCLCAYFLIIIDPLEELKFVGVYKKPLDI